MKLSLFYPTRPWYVTQKFGETAFLDYYKKNEVNFTGHNGMDVIAHHGDPVRASHDGTAYYQIDAKAGHGVVIISHDKFEYESGECHFKTIYWHLCNPDMDKKFKSPLYSTNPNIGTPVKVGDIIGYADSTGISQGDHLHFALKPVAQGENPNAWGNIEQNNGYQGAIDPAPYLNGLYAEDAFKKASNEKFYTNLRTGMKNNDVKRLQQFLKKLGYFTYRECTGNYGKFTEQAVLDFQLEQGIIKFGIESFMGQFVGPKTRAVLNNIKVDSQ